MIYASISRRKIVRGGESNYNEIVILILKLIFGTNINSPNVDSPANVPYIEGSTGNTITWIVSDNNPGIYNITKDGVLYTVDTSWTNGSISINVDGLSASEYSFMMNVYDVSGNMNKDEVIVTVSAKVDTIVPNIESPADVSYIEGSAGITITWTLGDNNPGVYNITKDGVLYTIHTNWSNGSISFSVNGLSVGEYSFIINVYDTSGNMNQDEVIITVSTKSDITVPNIDSPTDVSYIEGSTGNIITWTISDTNPGIYNITKDGVLYTIDTNWANGSISISVNGLSVGVYSFVIHVYDRSGNSISNEVVITVFSNIDTSISTTSDPSLSTCTSTSTDTNRDSTTPKLPIFNSPMYLLTIIPLLFYRRKYCRV